MIRALVPGVALLIAACEPQGESPSPADPVFRSRADDAVWQALEDRYLSINVRPSDPVDALEWVEVRCDFLAGELNGDNIAQSRAIGDRTEALRCGDGMLAGARVERQRQAGDPTAVARLDALLARHD